MHYWDTNKTAGEEARRQLHKKAARNIEQEKVAKEGQEYPCWRHDMMRMMIMMIFKNSN